MKTVVILGSSNSNGFTKAQVKELLKIADWDLVDLKDYDFSHYDYEHRNRTDDFLPLMKTLISSYDTFIFATPVYWYSMSGILKMFFDRITDLITIEKDLGRQLRGKAMGVLSCSNGENLGDSFWIPFKHTAQYLGMTYKGHIHTFNGTIETHTLLKFINQMRA